MLESWNVIQKRMILSIREMNKQEHEKQIKKNN